MRVSFHGRLMAIALVLINVVIASTLQASHFLVQLVLVKCESFRTHVLQLQQVWFERILMSTSSYHKLEHYIDS